MYNSTVKMIGYSNIDEKLCAAAGRISTQDGTALEIWEKSQDKEKNANLIGKVTRSGHNSTVEHAYFNLAFNNVSVVAEQFMIEFRLASFTVKSRRYVDFGSAGYCVPDFDSTELRDMYTAHMDSLFALYNELTQAGIPKEDARFVLPYCFRSNFFCSLNGRELIHVLEAMLFGRGSENKELFSLGKQLLEQADAIAPGIFGDFEERHQNYSDRLDLSFYDTHNRTESSEIAELLGYSKNAEKNIAQSALIQATQLSADEINTILKDEQTVEQIIEKVMHSGRPRALENAFYTFRLNKVSLACITHFARHRMQSVNFPDLACADRSKYIVPPVLKDNIPLLSKYKAAFEKTADLYNTLKSKGVDEQTLTYVLLAGNTLDFTLTMNARELLLFLSLRCCTRAQWEIQIYANEMLRKLRDVSPSVFQFYGPSCFVTGKCPEGRLSCGRLKEMHEKYEK